MFSSLEIVNLKGPINVSLDQMNIPKVVCNDLILDGKKIVDILKTNLPSKNVVVTYLTSNVTVDGILYKSGNELKSTSVCRMSTNKLNIQSSILNLDTIGDFILQDHKKDICNIPSGPDNSIIYISDNKLIGDKSLFVSNDTTYNEPTINTDNAVCTSITTDILNVNITGLENDLNIVMKNDNVLIPSIITIENGFENFSGNVSGNDPRNTFVISSQKIPILGINGNIPNTNISIGELGGERIVICKSNIKATTLESNQLTINGDLKIENEMIVENETIIKNDLILNDIHEINELSFKHIILSDNYGKVYYDLINCECETNFEIHNPIVFENSNVLISVLGYVSGFPIATCVSVANGSFVINVTNYDTEDVVGLCIGYIVLSGA